MEASVGWQEQEVEPLEAGIVLVEVGIEFSVQEVVVKE